MKAIKQYFHVVLFIMLYKVVPANFKSVDDTLVCGYSKESYWAVLSCRVVYFAVQDGSNVKSMDKIQACDHVAKRYLFRMTQHWQSLRRLLNFVYQREGHLDIARKRKTSCHWDRLCKKEFAIWQMYISAFWHIAASLTNRLQPISITQINSVEKTGRSNALRKTVVP